MPAIENKAPQTSPEFITPRAVASLSAKKEPKPSYTPFLHKPAKHPVHTQKDMPNLGAGHKGHRFGSGR